MIEVMQRLRTVLEDRYEVGVALDLEWATGTLHEIMRVISLGYYPAQICFPPIETDLVYKPFMSAEIVDKTASPVAISPRLTSAIA